MPGFFYRNVMATIWNIYFLECHGMHCGHYAWTATVTIMFPLVVLCPGSMRQHKSQCKQSHTWSGWFGVGTFNVLHCVANSRFPTHWNPGHYFFLHLTLLISCSVAGRRLPFCHLWVSNDQNLHILRAKNVWPRSNLGISNDQNLQFGG